MTEIQRSGIRISTTWIVSESGWDNEALPALFGKNELFSVTAVDVDWRTFSEIIFFEDQVGDTDASNNAINNDIYILSPNLI